MNDVAPHNVGPGFDLFAGIGGLLMRLVPVMLRPKPPPTTYVINITDSPGARVMIADPGSSAATDLAQVVLGRDIGNTAPDDIIDP